MSKRILGACLALSTLLACEESRVTTAATKPQPVIVTPRPIVVESIMPAKPVDAGVIHIDPIALAHNQPTVDHLTHARQLMADGESRAALEAARKAVFNAPDDEDALQLVATLARRKSELALAAEAWGRLARLRLDDATPLVQQARTLYRMHDFTGAAMAGREAVTRDSEHAEAQHVLGLAQLGMGELQGAIDSFERTVALAPEHGWAYNNLGFACLQANQNERAVSALQTATVLLPTVALAHNNLGVALERVGRGNEARGAYLQAMDLSPKYLKAHLNLRRMAKALPVDAQELQPLAPETGEPSPNFEP